MKGLKHEGSSGYVWDPYIPGYPGPGIWEEVPENHYTTSKVIASISLKYIAEHSEDPAEQKLWRDTSEQIQQYEEKNCITSSGTYAVYAGSDDTGVSAVLFPVWGYTDADTPVMLKTVEVLEKNYSRNHLYKRHRVEYDSQKKGVFWPALCRLPNTG
ncbi:MAG: glycoside hydrolase family 15 protein [Balneolaceae bacterium]